MSKNLNKIITVFIPTFNGEKYLTECIKAILSQQMPKGYKLELLIIDSGSKDETIEILNKFADHLRLIEIPNKEFTHGGTRDKAARLAKGEFILFLTQDATPSNDRWLINMVEPFWLNPQVGCVFGRQTPRVDTAPTIKREVATVFGALGSPDSIVIYRPKSLVDGNNTNAINTFFSDANSAVRRDLLIDKVPFRKVHYAEDQALSEDMQKNGYLKAYAPLGEVWHSNEYNAREYYQRKFDEFIGLYDSLGVIHPVTTKELLVGWIRPTLKDYQWINRDHSYSTKRKLFWIVQSPFYNIGATYGKFLASRNTTNMAMRQKISLEGKLRKKS